MDEALKKKVLRKIHYGLFVATSSDNQNTASGTINWVSQVSFKPPAVVIGVKKDSFLYKVIMSSKKFALNIVGKDQKDMAQTFFKGHSVESGKLGGYDVIFGELGCPIIKDAAGAFECEVINHIDFGGDHDIFVGKVVQVYQLQDKEPLSMIETGWYYGG
ncbi:MAG: flavin reductase family protein [bacterium]|nr:flavin reductase family protein [bacterium]